MSEFQTTSSSSTSSGSEGGGTDPTPLGTHPFDVTWVLDPIPVWITTVISTIVIIYALHDTREHSLHFTRPTLQRLTIRIQLMVPLYAALSVLALHLPENRFMIATIRDTYESFVLYEFLALLIAYCGGEAQLIHALTLKRYKGEHPAPCCCLPMFALDRDFFLRCKRWVLQYALIKPITSALAVVGHLNGTYRETDFDWSTNLFPWFAIINNISITYSLWYLVVFHNETERELAYCRPMLKFVCIKTIIFFAYWQGLVISFLVAVGFLSTGHDEHEREEVNGAVQDFLICVELIPVAIMHHYAFGYESFKQEMSDEPVFERIDGGYGKRARKNQNDTNKKTDADILDEVAKAREEEKQAVQRRFQQKQDQSLASKLQKYHSNLKDPNNRSRLGGKKMSVMIREPHEEEGDHEHYNDYNHDDDDVQNSASSLPNAEFRKRLDTLHPKFHHHHDHSAAITIEDSALENVDSDCEDIYDDCDVKVGSNVNTSNNPKSRNLYSLGGHDGHDPLEDTLSRVVRKKVHPHLNDDDDDDDDILLDSQTLDRSSSVAVPGSISMGEFMKIQKKKEVAKKKKLILSALARRGSSASLGDGSASRVSGGGTSSKHTTNAPSMSAFTSATSARIPPHLRGADLKAIQQAQLVEDAIDAVETSVLREALALQDFVSDTVQTIFYQGGGLLDTGGGGGAKNGGGNGSNNNNNNGDDDDKGRDNDEFDLDTNGNFNIDAMYNPGGPKFIDSVINSGGGAGNGMMIGGGNTNNDDDGMIGVSGGIDAIISSQRAEGAGADDDSTDSEAERDDADARGAGWCGDPAMMEFENDGEYPLVPWYDYRTGKRKEVLADGSLHGGTKDGNNNNKQSGGGAGGGGSSLMNNVLSLKRIYDLEDSSKNGKNKNGDDDDFYCTVCGRNDREMVKRSSGYKCVQCVGLKHQYFSPAEKRKSSANNNSDSFSRRRPQEEEEGKDDEKEQSKEKDDGSRKKNNNDDQEQY